MDQLHDEVLRLTSDLERIRQEHRVKKRALLADIRSKEDALQEWFDDERARIEQKKALLILHVASASQRLTSSGALQHELEPVTSSTPDNTMHLLAADQMQQQQQQQQQHLHQQSGMLALPARPHDAPSSGHSSHSHLAPDPADVPDHSHNPEHEAGADPEPLNDADIAAPACSPAVQSANAEDIPDAADPLQSVEGVKSYVEIDVTHVVPVAKQREAGMTTFMMCRPRHKRSKLPRAWPAKLWKPLNLEPVAATPISVPQPPAQPCAPIKLQTNDEALVENKDVASLVNVKDMTPAVWSDVLTPGPAFLRTSVAKGIRHTLWENHKWLKRRQSDEQTSDSGDDDTEQFGIRKGIGDGGEQAAADEEMDEDVLPLYGEADSDFGDSSSEVGAPSPSQGEEEDLIKDGNEAAPVSLADTYRGIMAGVGLAGSALEAWLEHWMKLLTAEVAEMAQGGIANTIPGSRAAELLVESRLSRAVAAIAEVLESMHQQWQSSQLPQLERRAHKTWQQAQHSDQQTHWQMDAGHWQEHLAKLVLEVARAHLYRAELATKALRRGCQSIQQILFNLHEVLFKLSVAHLPEAPPKPNRKRAAAERDSKQLPQASSGPSESAGSLTDNDGNASGSWLVDDAEDGGLGAPEGAAEVSSKRRCTGTADRSDSAAAEAVNQPDPSMATGTGGLTVAEGTGTGTGSAATPNMAWNAARLQTGMTEVLVAPGLRTPQEEAKPDPATTGTPEQAKASLEGYDAEGTLGDDTDSQALELHLDTNSEAGAVAGMVDLPLSSEAEEERATPVMGLVDDGGYPVEEEGVGGEDAGLQEADLDVQSMVSDGADSYQGLPAETSAHLAASAHDSMSGVGEDAEREVTIEGQVDALDAARQGQEVEEQQSPQEALEPGTEQEINLAAQSDALDAACEEHMEGEGAQSPQEAFQPSIEVSTARQSDDQDAAAHKAGMQIEAQQAPQKALESGTAAQTELHGEAGQEISMPEGQQLQLDDAVTEPGDQSELQMDVDSSLPEAAEASADSPVQDLTGFEAVGWDKGKVVEVHCSAADVPEVWAWRVGALGNPHLPGGPNPAIVQWRSNPSATLFSSELVEAARLRPAAPLETYIAQTDMPARGSILEVECNEGRGFKCAVLVCRQSPSLGGERDLHSIVHTRSAGVRHVVYLPELQQCVVQSSLMPIRRPMQYSPEQGSFQDLAEDQTSALLESWGFARTAAAAKVVAKRRESQVLQGLKEKQKAAGFSEAVHQRSFTRKHLARQPFIEFKRAKVLLNMGAPLRKRLLQEKNIHITAGPMKAAAAVADASPGGNKRKRSSNPGRRQQPTDETPEAVALQKDQRQEQRQEQGRKQREADALAQQEKLKERKQKKERRQSLAAATAAPLLTLSAQTDADAQPLFPEQKSASQVMVASSMVSKLKPHQWEGVRFLYRNIVLGHEATEEDDDEEDVAGGVILAHSMGLGKSLQTIAFLHTFHSHWPGKRSLLLVPSNVMHNWVDEFHRWLPKGRPDGPNELTPSKVYVYKSPMDVHVWSRQTASVLIISYDMFSRLKSQDVAVTLRGANDTPTEKAMVAQRAFASMCDEAEIVVADEGHQIKNPATKRFAAVDSLRTRRRIALTGYPLQNNLNEYYTMIRWCGDAEMLGEVAYFRDTFVRPIQEGQASGASKKQVQHMYKQLSVLQDMTENFMHRIGPEQLLRDLPAKQEHVVLVCLDAAQQRMYQAYLDVTANCRRQMLTDTIMLHLISHRPKEALQKLEKMAEGDGQEIEAVVEEAVAQTDAAEEELQPATSGDTHQRGSTPEALYDAQDGADSAAAKSGRKTRSQASQKLPAEVVQQLLAETKELEAGGAPLGAGHTAKAWATQHILQRCIKRGEKLVIFCQYIEDLKDIENGLKQKPLGWVRGKQYLWLDGSVAAHIRQQHTVKFNDMNSSARVFLISIRAGSVGINLTAACRMIIYDELWNPVHIAQAIARIYRYGQTRPTFVYRLLYKGTAEHRMYRRNVDKEGLFMRVVDKQTVKGTNRLEDVDIYAFDPPAPADVGTLNNVAVNSTDEVLKGLLRADTTKLPRCIAGWEDHRANLPEDPSQKLTAQQRREAARQFTFEEENLRGALVGGKKRSRIMKKRYADDEDFQLTPAEAAQLWAQQAAELEDTDVPPLNAPTPPAAQQPTLAQPTPQREPSSSVPAAAVVAALQTAASTSAAATGPTATLHRQASPTLARAAAALLQACASGIGAKEVSVQGKAAAGKAAAGKAAAGKAAESDSAAAAGKAAAAAPKAGQVAESGTSPTTAAAPVLKQSTPSPVTKADQNTAGAKPGSAQGTTGQPEQARRVPHSPSPRPSPEQHSASPSAAIAAAESAAGISEGASRKGGTRVWQPPAALASPQRSSGGLKEVADQAADRQLQKKRKAPEMPTSPFANHKAAHPASADRHPPGSKSMAAAGAGLGSHDAATRVKQKTGAGIDQAEDRQAKKQEQQRLSEPRASAASDASQGQTEAALGQGGAALGQSEGLQVRLPAAPLFVAQSPAGKGPAEGWVKRYLAMHPDCKEDEALKVWKKSRRQALSLKSTPEKTPSHHKQLSPSLNSVRSAMQKLKRSQHASQGPDQAKGPDATAPSGSGQPAGPRLPARTVKRSAPHTSHKQGLVSKDVSDAAATASRQQSPAEEEQASKLQSCGAVSADQAGEEDGQASRRKKDRKEKKRKHKESRQGSAAQEASAHQDLSSLARTSDPESSHALGDLAFSAVQPQDRKMMKTRRSRSPDPLEVTSPGRTPAQPSPSAFPELLDSAKRFAVVSLRPKLTSPSRHRPMLGKPASPTIQQLFSRQAASQSPGGAKPSSAPASAPVKSMSGNPAGGAEPAVVCTSVKGHESAAAATAVRERRPDEQRDRLLVNKQATGILSEVVNSSAAGRVAPLRSVISGERGGQQAVSGADAMNQSSTPISPDESSGVQQTSGADEQVMDVTSPARTGGRSDSSPESTGGQGGQSAHGVRVGRNWNRQERKLRKQFSGRQSIAAAEVIELD